MSKQPKKSEILIESGTNELEVMEFTIADRHFGINVAKVVEIMQSTTVNPMPNANPYIEGIFKPRDTIMTVINLPMYLNLDSHQSSERDIFIITNFNKASSAFRVNTVEAIHRISWTAIEKPDEAIYGGNDGVATGIARFDGRLITIIDFEKIIGDINPKTTIQISEIERMPDREPVSRPIMIAEDSPFLKQLILEALTTAGYTNIIDCNSGLEAWNKLNELKEAGGDIAEHCSCVITDIEMPQMDGHRLIKLIREDEHLKVLPCIIFSSLINEEMMRKGISLGATAQISKPEIGQLVGLIDKYAIRIQ
ncbi:MAG: chemotaxis protein [Defluviitaleaceae bacterium]|nr:chemotaxis protein [Defluviitaleaceae bacterium]